jgi:hypothetical protein
MSEKLNGIKPISSTPSKKLLFLEKYRPEESREQNKKRLIVALKKAGLTIAGQD